MESLQERFPILAHEGAGVDCCGCIFPAVMDNDTELRCGECGAVVGVMNTALLRDLVSLIP